MVFIAACLACSARLESASPKVAPFREIRAAGNYGIFIGVNEFIHARELDLTNAVNDAVAYAHMFVEQLGIIPATNCWLLISGRPSTAPIAAKLEALKALGVRLEAATTVAVNQSLKETELDRRRGRVEGDGLTVLAVASHGETVGKGNPDLRLLLADHAPSDTFRPQVLFSEIQKHRFPTSKRIFILDVCRTVDSRGPRESEDHQAFVDAFRNAEGLTTIMACELGEKSFGHPREPHGAFTFHLLAALEQGASRSAEAPFLTIEEAFQIARDSLMGELVRTKGPIQRPCISSSAPIPVASRVRLDQLLQSIQEAKEVLRKAYDPSAEEDPIDGPVLDALWRGLDHGPLDLRREIVGAVNRLLVREPNRKMFLTWWQGVRETESKILRTTTTVAEQAAGDLQPKPRSILVNQLTNSIGMIFLPVPGRENLWLSQWETRVRDFLRATNSAGLKADAAQSDHLPARGISKADAETFCRWLTETEKHLTPRRIYRLPTAAEWRSAANRNQERYAWGSTWPPPENVGNLAGEERESIYSRISGFKDPYSSVAPVGSFRPSKEGFYDLVGNVYEWTSTATHEDSKIFLLVGGAYALDEQAGRPDRELQFTNAIQARSGAARPTYGFRPLLEVIPDP
ncbi:MAG: SUMF1/EgtB/PvdO family nonheme iron enzyme [Verrucomicrobiales bacterium]|nr:SUMF1/EgtB/PvdO family nonheme iron enzyme [Verrucomicrobiales bacterium]